jgi:hypothetical protein
MRWGARRTPSIVTLAWRAPASVTSRARRRSEIVKTTDHLATAAIAVLIAATAIGCGGGAGSTDPTADGPLVTYSRGGGIAGVDERLRIEPDGSAVVSVGIDGRQSSFALTDHELAQLRGELEAADLGSVDAQGPPTGCADCFVYELTYGGRTISYDEASPVPEPVATVVADLGTLVDDR